MASDASGLLDALASGVLRSRHMNSLKILRFDVGLSVSQAEGCPLMGSQVLVTE